MATPVQTAVADTTTATTVPIVMSSAVSTGNLLTLGGNSFDQIAVTTVTGGGTWTKAVGILFDPGTGGQGTVELWYCLSATGGSTTVTVGLGAVPNAGNGQYAVTEWPGDWAYDQASSTHNGSGTGAPTPTLTPAVAGELLLAAASTQAIAGSVAGSFSQLSGTYYGDSGGFADLAYYNDPTTGTATATWPNAGGTNYSTGIVAFKPAPVTTNGAGAVTFTGASTFTRAVSTGGLVTFAAMSTASTPTVVMPRFLTGGGGRGRLA